jgi:hypothetical protein
MTDPDSGSGASLRHEHEPVVNLCPHRISTWLYVLAVTARLRCPRELADAPRHAAQVQQPDPAMTQIMRRPEAYHFVLQALAMRCAASNGSRA